MIEEDGSDRVPSNEIFVERYIPNTIKRGHIIHVRCSVSRKYCYVALPPLNADMSASTRYTYARFPAALWQASAIRTLRFKRPRSTSSDRYPRSCQCQVDFPSPTQFAPQPGHVSAALLESLFEIADRGGQSQSGLNLLRLQSRIGHIHLHGNRAAAYLFGCCLASIQTARPRYRP